MAKGKRTGKGHEAYYARYKSGKVWETNRIRKLKRALKDNPNNAEEINKALANITYRRKTPTTKQWSATRRRIAEIFKKFTGKVPYAAINTVPVDENYWKALNAVKPGFISKNGTKQQGSMFSLGARAHT
jgi:hypothetical protein